MFAGEDCEYLHRSSNSFLLDRAFEKILSWKHIAWKVVYIYLVVFALVPIKKGTGHLYLLTLLKIWCSFWSPKITKDEFEAAVISAIKKSFQSQFLLVVIYILISACGDKYKMWVEVHIL
jgi:hypothetical protein